MGSSISTPESSEGAAAAAAASSSSAPREPIAAAAASSSSAHRLKDKPDIGFTVNYKAETLDPIDSPADLGFGVMFLSHGNLDMNGISDISILSPELRYNFGLFDPIPSDSVACFMPGFIKEYYFIILMKIVPELIDYLYPEIREKISSFNILKDRYVGSLREEVSSSRTRRKRPRDDDETEGMNISNLYIRAAVSILQDPKLYTTKLPLLYLDFIDESGKLLMGLIIIEFNRKTKQIRSIGSSIINKDDPTDNTINKILMNTSKSDDSPGEYVSFIGDVMNRTFDYFKSDLLVGLSESDKTDYSKYPKFIFYPQSCRYVDEKARASAYRASYYEAEKEARMTLKNIETPSRVLISRYPYAAIDSSSEDDIRYELKKILEEYREMLKKGIPISESDSKRYKPAEEQYRKIVEQQNKKHILHYKGKGRRLTRKNKKNIRNYKKNRRRLVPELNKTL